MTNKRKVFNLSEGRFPTYKECYDENLDINEGNKLNKLFIKEVFKLLLKLKRKNRLIIFATHNRFFANMADCKIELISGKIKKTTNARIK